MSELITKFSPYVDEIFSKESKISLLTNKDYNWSGAKTLKIYKVNTGQMNDYDRSGTGPNWSRYGEVQGLDAITEEFTITRDRSFTYALDKMDVEETGDALNAAASLARQQREVIIPEVDSYVYSVICKNAGTKPDAMALTATNIYDEVLKANAVLDDAYVPETGRILLVTPQIYKIMKKSKDIALETDIGADMRLRGVVSNLDGAQVVKVPANRVPEKFGFALVHPVATVAPVKLADYRVHDNPPGINGYLVEGRIYYDAFVLDNKKKAIYYQSTV